MSQTPRLLDAIKILPTEEEFAAWCENPCTRFVATAFHNASQANRDAWIQQSWEHGKTEGLTEFRVRADAYRAFLDSQWADYFKLVDEQAWREWINGEQRLGNSTERGVRASAKGAVNPAGAASDAKSGRNRRRRAGAGSQNGGPTPWNRTH